MKARLNERRTDRTFLTILCMTSLSVLGSLSSAEAAPTVGGNDIIPRGTRDGTYDTTFVDMTHTIQATCLLTGWNIWAQSYAVNWPYNTAPRSLKLIILRMDGSDLDVVGKSELETVSEWDRAYHFDLTTPIPVQAGDLIGWYFPTTTVPGGSISFGLGSGTTRWSYAGEVFGSTPLSVSVVPGKIRVFDA